MPTGFPPLRVPTFNQAREAFLTNLSPDDISPSVWSHRTLIKMRAERHLSHLEAAGIFLISKMEQAWNDIRVTNTKNRDLLRDMDERANAIDPMGLFEVSTQIQLAQATDWKRVHSYGTFRMDRERFITRRMKSFLTEVQKPIPDEITNFLRFLDGAGPPEGKPRKERG